MNLTGVQSEMQEAGLWSLWPVQEIDTVLTNRYNRANSTLSLLYCDLYLRQFKETLKQTMLEQESVFEDQIHELHRLYQRQKELMMEMEGANNVCNQTQHLSFNPGASTPRTSIHWLSSSASMSEASVVPPEDASAKTIDEAGEKVLDLELPSHGYHDTLEVTNFPSDQSLESVVQPENVQHLMDLPRLKCTLDLNELAMNEEPSDYEFNQFLTPAKKRSERAEPEAEYPLISTKSRAEKGINLNMSPHSSEEKETIFKTKESEQPQFVSVSSQGKQGSGQSRVIVQALPCSETIASFFQKRLKSSRRSSRSKKKAKSSKAREVGLNLDLNVSIQEDDNHLLSTASCIPESDQNQEHLEKESLGSMPEVKPGRNMTNAGKRRRCKPRIESCQVMKKIARTKSKTRGSFVDTEKEELKVSAAAELLFDMSLSDSARKSSIEASDCITPLHSFAKIACSAVEDSKSEVGSSLTGFHSDYEIDFFEAMTLQLTEMTPEEQRTNPSVPNSVTAKQKRTPRSQGKRRQQQKDCHIEHLPSLSTFAENDASQDLDKIEKLIEASETNDAHYSLMKNMSIDWGTITKRRRGIRSPATKTKTSLASVQVPISDS